MGVVEVDSIRTSSHGSPKEGGGGGGAAKPRERSGDRARFLNMPNVPFVTRKNK